LDNFFSDIIQKQLSFLVQHLKVALKPGIVSILRDFHPFPKYWQFKVFFIFGSIFEAAFKVEKMHCGKYWAWVSFQTAILTF